MVNGHDRMVNTRSSILKTTTYITVNCSEKFFFLMTTDHMVMTIDHIMTIDLIEMTIWSLVMTIWWPYM